MQPIDIRRAETVLRPNITEALKGLKVGETIVFPVGTNFGSVRTIAAQDVGIRLIMRSLPDGTIQVTRKC